MITDKEFKKHFLNIIDNIFLFLAICFLICFLIMLIYPIFIFIYNFFFDFDEEKNKNNHVKFDIKSNKQKKHYKIKNVQSNNIKIPSSWNPNEFIVGIYRITNLINNKVYIGESIDIQKRWAKHFYDLSNNIHHNHKLQNDFNTYGVKSFYLEIIEKFIYTNYEDTKKRLLIAESDRINYEKSIGKILYNLDNSEYKNNEYNLSYNISKENILENNSDASKITNEIVDENENYEDEIIESYDSCFLMVSENYNNINEYFKNGYSLNQVYNLLFSKKEQLIFSLSDFKSTYSKIHISKQTDKNQTQNIKRRHIFHIIDDAPLWKTILFIFIAFSSLFFIIALSKLDSIKRIDTNKNDELIIKEAFLNKEQEWIIISDDRNNGGKAIYINEKSLNRIKNIVAFNKIVDLPSPNRYKSNFYGNYEYSSILFTENYDCLNKKIRTISYQVFENNYAQGKLFDNVYNPTNWVNDNQNIFHFVCK